MKTNLIIMLIIGAMSACTQKKKETIPAFNLLSLDSLTVFNTKDIPKGHPIVLVYFSPDCDQCQQETEDWIKNMNELKDIKFYFVTNDSLSRVKLFNEIYRIHEYPNIYLGLDYEYKFLKIYRPTGSPYLVIYNKDKELRYVLPGGAKTDSLQKFIENI